MVMSTKNKILIVDDEKFTRDLHVRLLSEDYETLIAENAQVAIELIKKEDIGLVFLDIMMPLVDGTTLCKMIKSIKNVPIIFITGADSLEEHLNAYNAGGDDLLVKPVSKQMLLLKAQKIIDSYRSREDLQDLDNMASQLLLNLNSAEIQLGFLKKAMSYTNIDDIGKEVLEAIKKIGLKCSVLVRSKEDEEKIFSTEEEINPIEKNILILSKNSSSVFEFRERLIINCPQISLLCHDFKLESEGIEIKNGLVELLNTAQELIEKNNKQDLVEVKEDYSRNLNHNLKENIDIQQVIQTIREFHKIESVEITYHLEDLINKLEKTYSWLGVNQEQEERLASLLNQKMHQIYLILNDDSKIINELNKIEKKI